MGGCASFTEPYWTKTHDPVLLTEIRMVDSYPCGRSYWAACSNRTTGVIEIRSNLTQLQRLCALGHEMKELAGFSHKPDMGTFAIDCGDGSIVPF